MAKLKQVGWRSIILLTLFQALWAGETPSTPGERTHQLAMDRATSLNYQGKYTEAAAIYEGELKSFPDDADVIGKLAYCLSIKAQLEKDIATKKKLGLKARELAERAAKLGSTYPLLAAIFDSFTKDGTPIQEKAHYFSQKARADASIREGERAFMQRDLKAAEAAYAAAFAEDPTNAMAALLTGDAFFSSGDLDAAQEWFRKSIALAPEWETPHRYLGDALYKTGKREEAYKERLSALLLQPYLALTRQHFTQGMRDSAESLGRKAPRFPIANVQLKDKEMQLNVTPDIDPVLLVYTLAAAKFRNEDFGKTFPKEQNTRRSLVEEVSAIESMISYSQEAEGHEEAFPPKWVPIVGELRRLKNEGLLEAYILLERPDEGLAQDYAAYSKDHRKELEQYIWLYMSGYAENTAIGTH